MKCTEMRLKKKTSGDSPSNLKELLDAMSTTDSFSHLQVMVRHRPEVGVLPQRYLMVTPDDFELVNLLYINYKDENVILRLQNPITKKLSDTRIDIHDKSFKFLFINWQDIIEMVQHDCVDMNHSETLLELDK